MEEQSRTAIVLKFGGTSVATEEGRQAIASRVRAVSEEGYAPVVVVSAMGRLGAPYATDSLLSLVEGLPPDVREHDLLMSTGELISAVVLAHELRGQGISAHALSGPEAGIRTDGAYGCGAILEIDTARLRKEIAAGVVPVVSGFQGMGADGSVCTLGRGGSDTSACAIGVALGAERVDIYTDVDGIMTADPRAVDGATVLESISAEELFQMARTGSKIVHTPAAELALDSGAQIRVRNTFSDAPGTTVVDIAAYRPSTVATAVSHAGGIARVRVALPYVDDAGSHMAIQTKVYRAMADAGVSIDMFTPVNDRLLFTVKAGDVRHAQATLDALGLSHKVREDLSKVTLVGAGMHGVPGVMARMAEYLAAAGVDILQASDSHTTISVLVRSADAITAVRALHDGFEL